MANESGSVDLGALSQEDQDALAALAAGETPSIGVTTAFLIIVNRDGTVIATSDLNQSIELDRAATADDMYGAAAVVQKDIVTSETVGRMQMAAMQQARAMQEAHARQQILSQVGGNLRG